MSESPTVSDADTRGYSLVMNLREDPSTPETSYRGSGSLINVLDFLAPTSTVEDLPKLDKIALMTRCQPCLPVKDKTYTCGSSATLYRPPPPSSESQHLASQVFWKMSPLTVPGGYNLVAFRGLLRTAFRQDARLNGRNISVLGDSSVYKDALEEGALLVHAGVFPNESFWPEMTFRIELAYLPILARADVIVTVQLPPPWPLGWSNPRKTIGTIKVASILYDPMWSDTQKLQETLSDMSMSVSQKGLFFGVATLSDKVFANIPDESHYSWNMKIDSALDTKGKPYKYIVSISLNDHNYGEITFASVTQKMCSMLASIEGVQLDNVARVSKAQLLVSTDVLQVESEMSDILLAVTLTPDKTPSDDIPIEDQFFVSRCAWCNTPLRGRATSYCDEHAVTDY